MKGPAPFGSRPLSSHRLSTVPFKRARPDLPGSSRAPERPGRGRMRPSQLSPADPTAVDLPGLLQIRPGHIRSPCALPCEVTFSEFERGLPAEPHARELELRCLTREMHQRIRPPPGRSVAHAE